MNHKKETLFKEQIDDLLNHNWTIITDSDGTVRIVNEQHKEIELSTLKFLGREINDYINHKEEEVYGEKRPLDELSIKRDRLEEHVLNEYGMTIRSYLGFEIHDYISRKEEK